MTIPVTLSKAAKLCASAPCGLPIADILKLFIRSAEAGEFVVSRVSKPQPLSYVSAIGRGRDVIRPVLEINGRSEVDPVDLCRVLERKDVKVPLELVMRIYPRERRLPFLSPEVGAVAEASVERAEAKRQGILGDLIVAMTEGRPGLRNGDKVNVAAVAALTRKHCLARLVRSGESDRAKGFSISHIREVISGVLNSVDSSDD